jgi:hypothetical protein
MSEIGLEALATKAPAHGHTVKKEGFSSHRNFVKARCIQFSLSFYWLLAAVVIVKVH